MNCDVAIIGGGPSGSTLGSLLRKYNPNLEVVILEREKFPRDHIGESQLPAIMNILEEMGVWDKVEAGPFPVKIGGTYRWGDTKDLWDFEFLPGEEYQDTPRPARFEGQRKRTAFQVDRSIYDQILLDHAQELGCKVLQQTEVSKVNVEGDRILGLEIKSVAGGAESQSRLTARTYVDCSGEVGVIRKALNIGVDYPTTLQNIAIWDYWQDAEWAISLGASGTLIQVLSLGWGWLWFIPITPTRTSIGLVVPASYYKEQKVRPEELYLRAVNEEPRVAELVANAKREGNLGSTKDWSFVADRLFGENWYLAGDAAGFADPILSAGMALAQSGARKVAYTILEAERGEHDIEWLKSEYELGHRAQIRHHIRFADYWYSANGCFTDLQALCSNIARDAGLDLNADEAFRWLASGGFAVESPGEPRAASFGLGGVKTLTKYLSGESATWQIGAKNRLILDLSGSVKQQLPVYANGRITPVTCFRKNGKTLPLVGAYRAVYDALLREKDATVVLNMAYHFLNGPKSANPSEVAGVITECLEALLVEGWIKGSVDNRRPFIVVGGPDEADSFSRTRMSR